MEDHPKLGRLTESLIVLALTIKNSIWVRYSYIKKYIIRKLFILVTPYKLHVINYLINVTVPTVLVLPSPASEPSHWYPVVNSALMLHT